MKDLPQWRANMVKEKIQKKKEEEMRIQREKEEKANSKVHKDLRTWRRLSASNQGERMERMNNDF